MVRITDLRRHAMAWALIAGTAIVTAMSGPIDQASAVPLQAGQHYAGGTVLEVHQVGLSVTVPQGWFAVLPQGSSFLMMTPDDRRYVVLLAEQGSLDDAQTFLQSPLPLGGGVVLQPGAMSIEAGNDRQLVVDYAVSGTAEPHAGEARVRSILGHVVAAFSLAPHGELADTKTVGQAVLASVRPLAGAGSSAQTQGAQSSANSSDAWHPYLMGRHLVRYYTGSGYSEEQHLYLCSDGHFRKTFGAGGHTSYGDGWSSGASQSNDAGRWHATGTGNYGTLILNFGDGSQSTINLAYENSKVHLDGTQWLRDPDNNYCS